jgi:hypothetical protein
MLVVAPEQQAQEPIQTSLVLYFVMVVVLVVILVLNLLLVMPLVDQEVQVVVLVEHFNLLVQAVLEHQDKVIQDQLNLLLKVKVLVVVLAVQVYNQAVIPCQDQVLVLIG